MISIRKGGLRPIQQEQNVSPVAKMEWAVWRWNRRKQERKASLGYWLRWVQTGILLATRWSLLLNRNTFSRRLNFGERIHVTIEEILGQNRCFSKPLKILRRSSIWLNNFLVTTNFLFHFCISVRRSAAEYKFLQLNDALQISTSFLFLNRYSISVRVIEISRRMLIAREAISVVWIMYKAARKLRN